MKHSIFINDDGIIEIRYVGPIGDEENMQLIKGSYELITRQIDQNQPALVLVDLSRSDHFHPDIINAKAMRDSEAVKMAGFGVTNSEDREAVEKIIQQSTAGDHVRLFDSRAEAVEWLLAAK